MLVAMLLPSEFLGGNTRQLVGMMIVGTRSGMNASFGS